MDFVLLIVFVFLLAFASRRATRGTYLTVVVAALIASFMAMR